MFTNLRLIGKRVLNGLVTPPTLERLARFNYKFQQFQQKMQERDDRHKEELGRKLAEREKEYKKAISEDRKIDVLLEVKKRDSQRKEAKTTYQPQEERKIVEEEKKEENNEENKIGGFSLEELRIRAILGDRKPNFRVKQVTSKMIVEGKIENFEVWIPMNALDENSRVMSLSFNIPFNFRETTETDVKIEQESKIITERILAKQTQDAKAQLKNLSLIMLNRHLENPKENEKLEKLLYP